MKYFYLGLLILGGITTFGQGLESFPISSINSPVDELNPIVSADGTTLYFTRARHPQNVGGISDPGDIWISRKVGDQWTTPEHGGKVINDKAYNGVAGVSRDGNTLYLLSHYDPSGRAKTQGLAVSRRSGASWSKPENIAIPYFQNKSSFTSGTLSADLNAFVYAAESYGSYGVEDLYVTLRQPDGKWSAPVNLGNGVNTQFQELSPSLAADGRTLYFSSNGRKGQGSFDVFRTTRLGDSWTAWSAPENLGTTINTQGRELFYVEYPVLGLAAYTSTTDSDGYGDIRIAISKEGPKPLVEDSVVEIQPVVAEIDRRLIVSGEVRDAKTQQPIAARIVFKSGEASNLIDASPSSGYEARLDTGKAYSIVIESRGYISALENVSLIHYQGLSLEMDFSLQPVEKGTVVNLRSVLFQQSTTNLLPESYPELDMVVAFMKENENVSIELAGHTDNRGVHTDNVKLSQDRVNTVKAYLVEHGIDGRRVSGKGYGGVKPIASNDNEDTRKLNRRVEFSIKKL